MLRRGVANGAFGAPRVCDQRIGVYNGIQTSQSFDNAGNGLREKKQIRPFGGFFERHAAIDRAPREAGFDAAPGTDARDLAFDLRLPQRQAE